jgi:signal transduction histidine kinase
MGLLIDDLLSYSQVSIKPKSFNPIDLNQLLSQVLNDLDLEIEQKNARIDIAQLGTLNGHHRQLQQLFQNIIGNALKYRNPEVPLVIRISSRTISGREIPVHLTSEDYRKDYKLIEITDNGIGFDQGDAERIFNVFTRLHGNTEYKGTGVGLSIARKVMYHHNGFITARGEPNKGASFEVYFPME